MVQMVTVFLKYYLTPIYFFCVEVLVVIKS
jgi:hypothetical protein